MTKEKILEMYNNPSVEAIYGFMYGQPFIEYADGSQKPDKVIQILKSELRLSKDKDSFFYVWGWPGPDYNQYKFKDYGKTWVFTDKELINEI